MTHQSSPSTADGISSNDHDGPSDDMPVRFVIVPLIALPGIERWARTLGMHMCESDKPDPDGDPVFVLHPEDRLVRRMIAVDLRGAISSTVLLALAIVSFWISTAYAMEFWRGLSVACMAMAGTLCAHKIGEARPALNWIRKGRRERRERRKGEPADGRGGDAGQP